MSVSQEQQESYQRKAAAGRSLNAQKAAATRKQRAVKYARQAAMKEAMARYSAARQEASAAGAKLPHISDFVSDDMIVGRA